MNKTDCNGCYNNDYNHGLGGAKECWSFDEAKELEHRYVIHKNKMPPYGERDIMLVPPCYKPQNFCVCSLDAVGPDGYWK